MKYFQLKLSLAISMGIILSNIFAPLRAQPSESFMLPGFMVSPAVEASESTEEINNIVIIESDEVTYSCKLFEWLDKIF